MNIFILIFLTFLILVLLYSIFLYFFLIKIKKLEEKIKKSFFYRSDNIPSLYEVTKNFLVKHNEVFENILKLRKIEFSQKSQDFDLFWILKNESLIHKELNFILKICKNNKELIKNNKFLYTREIIIDNSYEIWNLIELYKNIVKKFNKLIFIKNLTLIWFLIPIYKKTEI